MIKANLTAASHALSDDVTRAFHVRGILLPSPNHGKTPENLSRETGHEINDHYALRQSRSLKSKKKKKKEK